MTGLIAGLVILTLFLWFSRRRSCAALSPFDVGPALAVALEHLAAAREAQGRARSDLLMFARFALEDAREAASTRAQRAAVDRLMKRLRLQE